MVYFHAYMKVKAGRFAEFEALLTEVTPILAKHGWRLVGSFASVVGEVDTVVDVWQLPDANALHAGLADPELHALAPRNDAIIEWERRTIVKKLPIPALLDDFHED